MRIKELDAFRGIAATVVMIYHFTTIYERCYTNDSAIFSMDYGWLGVPFFFILSGFVITLTVEKCKSAKEFLLKRFLRLYPTYWICLTVTLLVVYLSKLYLKYEGFDNGLPDILMNYTMFHRYFNFKNIDGSYWSLLPELLFYLIMAALLWFGKHKQLVWYNTVLILIGVVHYFMPLPIIGKTLAIHYILLFMIGINFYTIRNNSSVISNHFLIAVNLFVGVFLYHIERPLHTKLFLAISFSAIVVAFYLFVYKKLTVFGKIKPLVYLGTISYALYLVHQNVGYAVMIFLEQYISSRELSVLLASSCCVLLASIITFSVEPVLKNKIKNLLNINY